MKKSKKATKEKEIEHEADLPDENEGE